MITNHIRPLLFFTTLLLLVNCGGNAKPLSDTKATAQEKVEEVLTTIPTIIPTPAPKPVTNIPSTPTITHVTPTIIPTIVPTFTRVTPKVAPTLVPTFIRVVREPQATAITTMPHPGEKPTIDPNATNPCATVPKAFRKECEDSIKSDPNFGRADPNEGSNEDSTYVENFDPNNIPLIAKSNFTELAKFSRMTKLRSGVGHDYSARTPEYDPTHRNCKSMKHYFIPMGVPRSNSLYANTPHSFKWMSIKYFAPVDGTIQDTSYSKNPHGTEVSFTIESSEYLGYHFRFFHVALDPNLKDGSSVQAGQQIGTIGDEEAWGEILVEVRINADKLHLISFLQVATDKVFQEYKDRGVKTRLDATITKEYRDANPLACDDSSAGWFVGSGRGEDPGNDQFQVWQFESTDNWVFFN
jgi:hypothetical protein